MEFTACDFLVIVGVIQGFLVGFIFGMLYQIKKGHGDERKTD
jgi:hypothetical protein